MPRDRYRNQLEDEVLRRLGWRTLQTEQRASLLGARTLVTRGSWPYELLLGARKLLGAPGLTTRSKKLPTLFTPSGRSNTTQATQASLLLHQLRLARRLKADPSQSK